MNKDVTNQELSQAVGHELASFVAPLLLSNPDRGYSPLEPTCVAVTKTGKTTQSGGPHGTKGGSISM